MNRLTSRGSHLTPHRSGGPMFFAACLLASSLCAPPAGARAQDLDDVSISGLVADERGAAVAGASVTAILAETKLERTARADGAGRYRLFELPPGTYAVRAASAGFAAEEKAGLVAGAGASVRLDFALRPAHVTAEQTILGEADAPPVDTARTVVGGAVTRDELESLPLLSRSPLDLIFTLGGVTEEPLSTRGLAEDRDPSAGRAVAGRAAATPEEAGAFALAGGAPYSNNITVDGLDNNDDRGARDRFQPSVEAVEEVQVITNQFSAEYGRASGGRVNLRTRAGAGELHGRLFHFFRDESLDANTPNNKRRGLKRLPLQQHTAGFTLGGPLALRGRRRGHAPARGGARTFFHVAYEQDLSLDSALIDALVPIEASPLFPLPAPTALAGRRREASATGPNEPAELAPYVERVDAHSRNQTFTARLDHNFKGTHNAAFLLQLGRLRDLRQFGGGLRLAESLQGRTRDTEALSYTDNYVFSASVVNQLRAQVSRLSPSAGAPRGGAAGRPVVLIDIRDPLDGKDPSGRSGTLVAGPSSAGASGRRETRFQLQDTLTVVRGSHTLKLGADAHRIRSVFRDLADATGTYSFTSAGDFLAAAPARFRQRFHAGSTQRNTYAGLFVHDEWRPLGRVTLSAGLRYERETILGDGDNFAPRFAVAYDPAGSGKTVLRFGAGVFYGRVMLRTLDDFTLGTRSVEFDTNDLPAAERRPFIAANLRFPAALADDSPLVLEFGARASKFSRRLSPDLRTPESYQANFGAERELAGAFVIGANYTFHRGLRLWREYNANAPVLPPGRRDFADYLLASDFANFRDPRGVRPVYDAASAGELVRFTVAPPDASNPEAAARTSEFGVPVTIFNLNSVASAAALEAALAALRRLRPDPSRGQVEELVSVGNSFYHGLTVEVRRRARRPAGGLKLSLRAAYTLSRLVDDGVVNTSSALRAGDFRAERARSLLDRRHRFVFSGTLDTPRRAGGFRLATILRLASGAPFNISLGGDDRNLDDVGNDRPDFSGDLTLLRARRPGEQADPRLLAALSLPLIGRTGNLPRNAGRGPGLFAFDLSVTREFRAGERVRLRPVVEFENLLNKTVFSFGAEFVNFDALRPAATPEQRRAFLDTFLVPTRTLRPRTVRVGLRLDF